MDENMYTRLDQRFGGAGKSDGSVSGDAYAAAWMERNAKPKQVAKPAVPVIQPPPQRQAPVAPPAAPPMPQGGGKIAQRNAMMSAALGEPINTQAWGKQRGQF
jgi:hypothetical protein